MPASLPPLSGGSSLELVFPGGAVARVRAVLAGCHRGEQEGKAEKFRPGGTASPN